MTYVAISGKTPEISLAELEAVFGDYYIKPASKRATLIKHNAVLSLAPRLGGTIKIAKLLTEISSRDWNFIADYLHKNLPLFIDQAPEGKLTVGLSAYDIKVSPGKLNACALSLKKLARGYGKSVRIVPSKDLALTSAQVHHNKLISDRGFELVLIGTDHGTTLLALTVFEQNIDSYSARDRNRPYRDSKVGMLPPKLAQSIINLAKPNENSVLLDPFCGTGVILQEAMLMGFDVYGTDLEPRMVEYSKNNIDWFIGLFQPSGSVVGLGVGDATNQHWQNFGTIACETYLGRALTTLPDDNTLEKIVNDCDTIHKKFLKNVASQTKPGFRMCIAVPAWSKKSGFKHLPVLDHLEELGYNRISFVHVGTTNLVYHRENQTVARELVVLIRK